MRACLHTHEAELDSGGEGGKDGDNHRFKVVSLPRLGTYSVLYQCPGHWDGAIARLKRLGHREAVIVGVST